jgi:3-methyladenine DNA glycosylase/8-oxoguanine DNA glycosylase
VGATSVVEVRPPWPFRLPRHGGVDGVSHCRGGILERLMHHGEQPVVVRVTQPAPDRVVFDAHAASDEAAAYGIARMRFALGVDEDLRTFHRRFERDPLIGASVRRRPWLRVRRRPEPWEALAWAVCEQLIEFERAAAIERRLVWRLGRRWPRDEEVGRAIRCPPGRAPAWPPARLPSRPSSGRTWRPHAPPSAGDRSRAESAGRIALRDVPTPAALASVSPALLQSLDLGGTRARTLVRVAREVARGRIDLHDPDHEHAWRRLRAIPGIGPWTVEMLALHGQGRHDQLPAGDDGLLKLVGRALSGGDPHVRAHEREVREFFAPYEEWVGLAALHMMSGPASGGQASGGPASAPAA